MAYNKLIDLNLLSNFLSKIKSLIPTKTSDLENDSEYITGMEILSYGNSTWNDFLTAYTAKKVVYCRASSNSNPASGSQTRLAFMAYVNNADNPTNVEFQYYRSVNSHTSTQQGDQVFVYKLDKTSGWSVITREASSKIAAGTNMTSSYSNGTLTLNADTPTKGTVGLENVDNIQQYSATNPPPYPVTSVNGSTGDVTINIPSNVSDLTNDSGYITGITSSDVTTALGYTPSNVELLNNYRTTTEQNEIDDAQDERLDAVEQITTATTIGPFAIATFDASATNMPIKNLTVNIEPTQDLHGYDSPWPAGSRKNLLNPDSERFYRYITDTVWKYSTDSYSIAVPIAPNTTYTLSGYPNDMSIYRIGTIREESLPSNNADVSLYQVVRSTTYADFGASCTITTDEYATYLIIQFSSSQMASVVPNLQLELGSTATSFAPYSNICPISGWTNCKLHHTGVSLIGGDAFIGNTFSKTANGYQLSYNGSSISNRASAWAGIRGLPAGRYTIAMLNPSYPEGAEVNIRRSTAGSTVTMGVIIGSNVYGRRTYNIPENTTSLQLYIIPDTMPLNTSITMSDIVLVREADDDFPEPYNGNVYSITFPSEAGTVYGGTLDVVNRKLNSYPYYSSYNGETIIGPWISSMDVYTPGATPTLGAQVVDMGGAATSYDLSDVPEITTLFGENNIWANRGDVTVTYGAYLETVKVYADQAANSAAVAESVLESISADYTELNEDVNDLRNAFALNPLALQYTSDGTGFVKHADGAIGTSTLSSHTDYVDISGYPYLYYKRQGSNANNPTAGMAFYDENKAYICGETAVAQQAQSCYMTDLKKIAVPPNAKYARFSTYTDENTYGIFEVYGESPIVNKIKETDDVIIPLLPESLPFGLNSGQYVYSDGVITKKDGYYTTTYIDVTNINKIIYTRIATPESWGGYGIAWFDENKEVLANTGTGSVQYAQDYSYVLTVKDVPTGAKYIMLTVMDRDNLNLPFGIYDYAKYEKAIAPNAKKFAPVVGSPRLYLATAPVDPDFDIRSSSSGGTSYSDIYSRYDALCTAYPHWIKRGTDIGVDSENNPIARYTVRMYDPLVFLGDGVKTPPFIGNIWENVTQYRRALLTAGVHGNERVGVMGLYYLIKDILTSNDEWARYIKSNYIIEIIPIINPGGFNANRRRNANNVDINRDYMKKTTVEAQVMTTFIQSIKNDLYCAMDFHGSYELGFLATPQNSHIINKMMTLATQTISVCADDWGSIESIIGNTSDYYPYAYGCLSQNAGTLPYYILMNNITPYVFTVESPCLLLDTTVQANSAKVVAAAKMAMDQGCNVLQALLCI